MSQWGDFDSVNLIWLVVILIALASALSIRRMSFSFLVRSLLSWAAIIGIAVLGVAHRHELKALFASATATLGIDDQQVEGRTVRIRMSPDGHFWARVSLNGIERRMLIDSGATITAISARTAESANIKSSDAGLPVTIETANGTVAAQRGRIQRLAIGPLETEDLGVVISDNFGDLDVLGMNFLSRLHSWRVENSTLILEPRQGAEHAGEDATADPADTRRRRATSEDPDI